MTVARCVFCGKEQEDFKGVYLIKNDGSMNYYSSSKCLKNHQKLKRDPRKVRWADAFHVTRKKRAERLKELEARAEERLKKKKESEKKAQERRERKKANKKSKKK